MTREYEVKGGRPPEGVTSHASGNATKSNQALTVPSPYGLIESGATLCRDCPRSVSVACSVRLYLLMDVEEPTPRTAGLIIS